MLFVLLADPQAHQVRRYACSLAVFGSFAGAAIRVTGLGSSPRSVVRRSLVHLFPNVHCVTGCSTPRFDRPADVSVPGVLGFHGLCYISSWLEPSFQDVLVRSFSCPMSPVLCTRMDYFPGGRHALYLVWAHPWSFVYRPGCLPVGVCSHFSIFLRYFDSYRIAYFVSNFYLLPPLVCCKLVVRQHHCHPMVRDIKIRHLTPQGENAIFDILTMGWQVPPR